MPPSVSAGRPAATPSKSSFDVTAAAAYGSISSADVIVAVADMFRSNLEFFWVVDNFACVEEAE